MKRHGTSAASLASAIQRSSSGSFGIDSGKLDCAYAPSSARSRRTKSSEVRLLVRPRLERRLLAAALEHDQLQTVGDQREQLARAAAIRTDENVDGDHALHPFRSGLGISAFTGGTARQTGVAMRALNPERPERDTGVVDRALLSTDRPCVRPCTCRPSPLMRDPVRRSCTGSGQLQSWSLGLLIALNPAAVTSVRAP